MHYRGGSELDWNSQTDARADDKVSRHHRDRMAGYLRLLIAWVASVGVMLSWFVLISLLMLVAAYLCRLVPLAGRRRSPRIDPPK